MKSIVFGRPNIYYVVGCRSCVGRLKTAGRRGWLFSVTTSWWEDHPTINWRVVSVLSTTVESSWSMRMAICWHNWVTSDDGLEADSAVPETRAVLMTSSIVAAPDCRTCRRISVRRSWNDRKPKHGFIFIGTIRAAFLMSVIYLSTLSSSETRVMILFLQRSKSVRANRLRNSVISDERLSVVPFGKAHSHVGSIVPHL